MVCRRSIALALAACVGACGNNTASIEQGAGSGAGGGDGIEDQDSATGQSSAVTLTGDADGESTDAEGTDAADDTIGQSDTTGDGSTTGEPAMPRWVAVGPEVIAYSTDSGRSWQPAASGANGRDYDAATDGPTASVTIPPPPRGAPSVDGRDAACSVLRGQRADVGSGRALGR